MSNTANHQAQMVALQAIMSFGVIVQVKPEEFLKVLTNSESPLVLTSFDGFFRPHYRYLTAYKRLTFFTKCYESLTLPPNAETIKVESLKIPHEEWTIY